MSEILGVFGNASTLIGRTTSCNYPQSVQKVTIVGNLKPYFEKLISLNPKIVVYDPILYNDSDILKLKELGLDVFEMKSRSLDEFLSSLVKLGEKLGGNFCLRSYICLIRDKLTKGCIRDGVQTKVAILLGDSSEGEYYIAGKATLQGDILHKLGCNLVGPDSEKFEKANIESLVSQDPEVIFTKERPETLFKDPRLQSITALVKHRVYSIDPDILLRAGARVDKLIEYFSRYLNCH